jgi:hypothetical protein
VSLLYVYELTSCRTYLLLLLLVLPLCICYAQRCVFTQCYTLQLRAAVIFLLLLLLLVVVVVVLLLMLLSVSSSVSSVFVVLPALSLRNDAFDILTHSAHSQTHMCMQCDR